MLSIFYFYNNLVCNNDEYTYDISAHKFKICQIKVYKIRIYQSKK